MESNSRVNVSSPSASKTATSTGSATTRSASRTSKRTRLGFQAIGLALLVLGVGVAAADTPPVNPGTVAKRTADLDRWLFEVRTANDADVASGAVQQATTAIARAREPGAKLDAVLRAQSIAEASLVLAERQMARQKAAEALLAAEERVANTKERANAQRRVLEALMRERATLALAEEEAQR